MKYQPKNIIVKSIAGPGYNRMIKNETLGLPVYLTPQGEFSLTQADGKFIGVAVNRVGYGPIYDYGFSSDTNNIDRQVHAEFADRLSVCWTGQVSIKAGKKDMNAGKPVVINSDGEFETIDSITDRNKVVGIAVQNISANSYGDIILTNILINK